MNADPKYLVILASGLNAAPWGAPTDLATAIRDLGKVKAQGRTAWIEDSAGRFVPVKGASRKPNGYERR